VRFSNRLQSQHSQMITADPHNHANAGPDSGNSLRQWIWAGLAGLAVSLAIVAPFLWLGNASGHDFEFHAASWLEVANQWKQHIAYPRWDEWANYGLGEPRFVFYPPLSWMLGAALSFVVPWNAVPAAFIVLTQTVACLSAFALARRWLPPGGAVAAAIFYAANPYALLVIYMRSDFAEQLASAFLPLLFLFGFALAGTAWRNKRASAKAAVLFAIVFAAIWLANAPAGVLAAYSMALLFAWLAFSGREWRRLVHGAGGLALGLGLAAFYVLPAAYEQRWVNIGQVLSTGLQPAENFLYSASTDPEHTLFNWIASTIAVLLALLTAVAAMVGMRWAGPAAEQDGDRRPSEFRALLLVSGAALLLMLRVTTILWLVLPKLRFLQFPWRWMAILAVPGAVFLGAAWLRRLGRLLVIAALAITMGTGVYLVRHTWWDADDIPTLRAAMERGTGLEGTDEYDPAGDDHTDLPQAAPHVRILAAEDEGKPATAAVILQRWTPEDRRLRVHSRERVRLALRLLNYPAWRVEVNGQTVATQHPDRTEQMIVPVPAGDSEVSIEFVRTRDRTIGAAISGVSVLVAIALLVWPPRRIEEHSEERSEQIF
jgi:hypothetical protein